MANISFDERMRRGRIKNAWSQSELAEKLGVTQGTISNWENGRGGAENKGASEGSSNERTEQAEEVEQAGPSAFGSWLNRVRNERDLSVAELASKAAVSVPAIYNIESGRIENPRAQTVRRLEQALGKELPAEARKEIKDEATIGGVREFFAFDPMTRKTGRTIQGSTSSMISPSDQYTSGRVPAFEKGPGTRGKVLV